MRGKYRPHHILEVVLLVIALAGFSESNSKANENSKYLDAVREFADNVLKYGRDTYGPKYTPLFVDGLNKDTHEPVKWIAPNGDKWILSNLASQQNLFRTLDGLTTITGDPKYKQAAEEAIRYAFANLRSPNGLLYWGVKVAYDAQKDSIYNPEGLHIFKSQHPYYELMWEVDAEATRQFIEAFWSAHILDWSNLDMNRIGRFNRRLEKPWIQKYTGGPVFFQSRGKSMLTTGSDLFCAAGLLTKLSGDREPLNWAKRLAYRYIETRDPHVGISGHRYTRTEIDAAQYQFGEDFKGHIVLKYMLVPPVPGLGNPDVRESILGYIMITPGIEYSVMTGPWASFMLLGDTLDINGRDFIKWGLEELTALGKVAYRQQDNVFIPMFTNGISLEGYVCKKDSVIGWRGLKFKAIPAVAMDFWVYALSYRITGDQFMWHMARNIASGHGLGDIGIIPEKQHQLKTTTNCWQPFTLLGFLELYRKTGNQAFLQIAQTIGDNLLVQRFHKGFFVPSDKHIYTKFDAIEPLALLHLHNALKASSVSVPIVWSNRSIFDVAYRHRRLATDNSLIYTLTDSLEPPKSLFEVATEGDLDGVKAMLARGANVNARNQFGASALHYASQQGHIEVVKLLIVKGARVDAGRITPLHYAAENGYKDIVELLIVKGADVDAKNAAGQTPLHYVAENGRKDIAEMLIANGAGFNAKNMDGDTPLHYAARIGLKDIADLLIARGADVNAKDNNGQTPLDIAMIRNRTNIAGLLEARGADVSLHVAARIGALAEVKSLIEKGADINAKDTSGQTPLHYAVQYGHEDVVKLLIAKGADVNAKDKDGNAPGHVALSKNNKSILELLIAKGADLTSIHLSSYLGDLDKVRSFIEKETDVSSMDSYGATPLHYAAMRGREEVVEFLFARGADVNAKNKLGETPLHGAARGGHKDVVELLIDNAANINATERRNYTPMHYVVWSWNTEVAKLIIEKGADVQPKDRWGWTPLHYAVDGGNRYMAELLIVKGADVNAKGNSGKTALSLAKKKGHTEIVELLRKHAADLAASSEQRHDVAITGVSALSRDPRDYTVPLVVNLENQGNCGESFNVKLIDVTDSTLIGTKSVYLSPAGIDGMDEVSDMIFPSPAGDPDFFGQYVNCGGDVDGDGYNDIIISAPRWNEEKGRAYLYYGGPNMDANPDMIFEGEHDEERLGEGLSLGDLNGDGYDDVILGACKYRNYRGRVYVFHGGPDIDQKRDLVIEAEEGTTGAFGYKILVGDVDNDNYDDLLLTAPAYAPIAPSWKGRAYLYYGGDPMDTICDRVFEGENIDDHFGIDAVIGGDVDGDGYKDILIGALFYPGRNPELGRAYLYYGNDKANMDTTCDVVFECPESGRNQFGYVETVDIDKDGHADVLVGARFALNFRGRVYVYWGNERADMDAIPDMFFTGEKKGNDQLSGNSIHHGYFNDDNYPDIAVGAHSWQDFTGRVHVYYGNEKALIDESSDKVFTGVPRSRFGVWFGVGDLNNDRYDDIVVGGYMYNKNQGRAWLYYGGPGDSTQLKFDWDTTKASQGKHLLKVTIAPVAGEEDTEDNSMTTSVYVKEPFK